MRENPQYYGSLNSDSDRSQSVIILFLHTCVYCFFSSKLNVLFTIKEVLHIEPCMLSTFLVGLATHVCQLPCFLSQIK